MWLLARSMGLTWFVSVYMSWVFESRNSRFWRESQIEILWFWASFIKDRVKRIFLLVFLLFFIEYIFCTISPAECLILLPHYYAQDYAGIMCKTQEVINRTSVSSLKTEKSWTWPREGEIASGRKSSCLQLPFYFRAELRMTYSTNNTIVWLFVIPVCAHLYKNSRMR